MKLLLSLLLLGGITIAASTAEPPASATPAPRSVPALAAVLKSGRLHARQKALAQLATLADPAADRLLLAQFDRYRAGTLPPALWLDLFEAAARRDTPELKAQLAAHEREIATSRDPLSRFRDCLEGGDAEAGRQIFFEKPEAGCVRCHRVSGEGASIGPELTSLRQATDRVFILESIVDPNTKVTVGYQNVLLTLTNGEMLSGILSFESSSELVITSVTDGKKRTVLTEDVKERTPLPSAMPPGFGQVLGKRAIRDLVEFLAKVE
jgi:putative heme-binding domain-containing protein